MSQQNQQQQPQNPSCPGPPRKFLKKYEGLKRFGGLYKPPLPQASVGKVQRRQTFVKFKLDHNITNRGVSNDSSIYYPEILRNDSINLSTEIPKIAPPKIMHTPIRPNRQALGTLNSQHNLNRELKTYDLKKQDSPDETGLFFTPSKSLNQPSLHKTPIKIDPLHDKNLTRKVTKIQPTDPLNKMVSFNGFRKPATPVTSNTKPSEPQRKTTPSPPEENACDGASKRYNLRSSRKEHSDVASDDDPVTKKKETGRTKRLIKAVVERHDVPSRSPVDEPEYIEGGIKTTGSAPSESKINGDIDSLMKRIEKKKNCLEVGSSSDEDQAPEKPSSSIHKTPVTETCNKTLATSSTFDLSTPTPGSYVLALGQQIQKIQSKVNELTNQIGHCECGAIQQPSQKQPQRPATRGRKAALKSKVEKNRPSADADNNSTKQLLVTLVNEVAQLNSRFDNIHLNQ